MVRYDRAYLLCVAANPIGHVKAVVSSVVIKHVF